MARMGSLFIISAASGSGKTSLVKAIVNDLDDISLSISFTTRRKRLHETEGLDYFFVTERQFLLMKKNHEFLESIKLYGNYYATSKKFVLDILNSGKDILLEIDYQGAKTIKEQIKVFDTNLGNVKINKSCVTIFILPPSLQVLSERLINRGQDDSQVIEKRLSLAKDEIRHYVDYDYLIVNNDFEKAKKELLTIINSNRLIVSKQEIIYANLIHSLLA